MIRNEESLKLGFTVRLREFDALPELRLLQERQHHRRPEGTNMGQREKLSDVDIELLRLAYNCHNIPSRMVRTNRGTAHKPWRP
ncbi:unnamed protein product [Timema podura]|uniref:Uncharacterized protein n=1 Tax=Timema podura TaxID=61482 RepID=A0ABN7P6R9_TIMPD|nr:unnamed protein product [Timema podura]